MAKKVLVVITDNRVTSKGDIEDMAKLLQDDGIRIIAVPLGYQSDPKQLEKTASKEDVLPSKETDSPKKIADKIMERALGKFSFLITILSPLAPFCPFCPLFVPFGPILSPLALFVLCKLI